MTQESTKNESLTFKRGDDEKNPQLYARGQRFVGAVDKRNKTIVALAELEARLNSGQHVQNRTLQTYLTHAQYTAIQTAWEQQKLIRSGSKHKPQAIKLYEAALNSVQLQDTKAKELYKRGHAEGAAATEELCKAQMQALIVDIEAEVTNDPTLSQWLDRTIPAASSALTIEQMPRSITSNSKSSRVVRKSKADVKLEAVQAAISALIQDED